MNNKKGKLNISINELNTVENDPTILKAKMIVFDFEVSGNRQCITKEVAEEYMNTLIGKRICCKYISQEDNYGLDALGSHEKAETTDRNGEDVVYYMTDAIGFIENVYIDMYTNNNGEEKEAVFADAILWNDDHYQDIINLLNEWLSKNITIHMSCEYLYSEYTVKNGIEYILNPLFVTHTLLNSEDRNECMEIAPSYECAKLLSINELQKYNKAINSLKSNNELEQNKINTKKEEINTMENIFLNALKSNNQLSFGDIRDKLFDNLAELMNAKEYNSMWISQYGIYDDFFIYETFEEDKYVTYKVSYTTNEDDTVTINLEGKEKVEGQYTYVSVNELEDLKKSNNEKTELKSTLETKEAEIKSANEKIEELNKEIKSLNEKVTEKSTNAKENMDKFNELAEKLVSLNAQIEILKPLADKYNEEQYNKALNEAKENYKEKFKKANALEVFEEKSTQELIEKSINSDETISKEAKYSLNSLIVDNIKPFEKVINEDEVKLGESKLSINEITKTEDKENLIPTDEINMFKEYGL